MLLQSLKKETCISVPNSDSVVTRTGHQMVAIRFYVLDAGHLVIVPLQSLVAFEFLFFVQFPEFNGHVSGATCHVLPIRIEANVIYHTRMFSKGLLNLARLIVPYLYGSIFTGSGKLVVDWVENASGHSGPMSHHLQFLWFSRNCVSCTLFHVFFARNGTHFPAY